jgi:hypothetical protein
MSKGRTPRGSPSDAQRRVWAVLDAARGRDGYYELQIRHDDDCATIRSQNMADCTCSTLEYERIDLSKQERASR